MDDVALLSRLVSFDTASHRSNLALVDFLCEYAAPARAERVPSPDGTKANLVLRFGPDEGEGLILCGHMDVVPAEEEGWRSDPFRLREEEGRLFARGACDMKGFLAVATNLAMAETGGLRGPLVLVLTYDEETGTAGARDLVERWPLFGTLPRRAIIGEPTELSVVRMHKGHVRVRITMRGVAAHSALPHLGRNAIEAAARVLASLRGLRHRLERAGGPNASHFPEAPHVTLNVGRIEGGVATNVVPDRCLIDVGVRPLPGMEAAEVVQQVREAVANAAGDAPFQVDVPAESPPMLLDRGSPLHGALCAAADQHGEAAMPYATDGGWLARAGISCAVFGPGSISVAHKPNEYVTRADLSRARTVLRTALGRCNLL
ncbi:MAG TPA: acetylornithine deacetylase [Planctomycetota bacterium]|nr:acetylornithine deacetylase [Planctomycetota bacterium]